MEQTGWTAEIADIHFEARLHTCNRSLYDVQCAIITRIAVENVIGWVSVIIGNAMVFLCNLEFQKCMIISQTELHSTLQVL